MECPYPETGPRPCAAVDLHHGASPGDMIDIGTVATRAGPRQVVSDRRVNRDDERHLRSSKADDAAPDSGHAVLPPSGADEIDGGRLPKRRVGTRAAAPQAGEPALEEEQQRRQ